VAVTRDADELRLMLQLIGHIRRRLGKSSLESFEQDRDEIDLTAFRLAHIGEASKRLSQSLKSRYAAIDWRSMYDMRNALSHDYGGIIPSLIWRAVTNDLTPLEVLCRAELERLAQ
jgi:uncharacterized protein with HEPN domain